MSSPLDQLAKSLPKTPVPPKGVGPIQPPASTPQANVPIAVSDPSPNEMAVASINYLTSDQCSDADRYAAFRTLSYACGRDLVVRPWTVVSHIMTAGSFTAILLLVVKSISFGKAVSGTVYSQFTPNLLMVSGVCFAILLVIFRRKPDIVLLLACSAAGVLGAIGLSALL